MVSTNFQKELEENKRRAMHSELKNMNKPKSASSSYRVKSRQISNFALPDIPKFKPPTVLPPAI